LEVARGRDGRLHVVVETTDELVACGRCGVRAQLKEQDRVALVDLPAFGTPVRLVWVKRRWRCREPLCPVGSWTERNDAIAAERCGLTRRAGLWANMQVGLLARPVSQVAAELGVAWHTVMDAVVLYGTPLIDVPGQHGYAGAPSSPHLAYWARPPGGGRHRTRRRHVGDQRGRPGRHPAAHRVPRRRHHRHRALDKGLRAALD